MCALTSMPSNYLSLAAVLYIYQPPPPATFCSESRLLRPVLGGARSLQKNRCVYINRWFSLSFLRPHGPVFRLHLIAEKIQYSPPDVPPAPPGFASLTSFCRSIFSVRSNTLSLSLLPSSTDLFYGALSKTEGVFTAKRCF